MVYNSVEAWKLREEIETAACKWFNGAVSLSSGLWAVINYRRPDYRAQFIKPFRNGPTNKAIIGVLTKEIATHNKSQVTQARTPAALLLATADRSPEKSQNVDVVDLTKDSGIEMGKKRVSLHAYVASDISPHLPFYIFFFDP
ncbi:concanavalin A-like lectins/glucanase [Striga asiatica]|uniref:Concanavalin A-like lectins/glucanase n=1 Tax=Striga asiatica TaxID=4170 RepID=A0A5A7P6F4_STRAF|nr:concanavalin A-like lectins/glucanase [Striga asiatica]